MPTAPVSIFTPASEGGPPTAPAEVFVPEIGAGAPTGNIILAWPGAQDINANSIEGLYLENDVLDGKHTYIHDGTSYRFRWISTGTPKWILETSGQVAVAYSLSDVATPDLAADWKDSGSDLAIESFAVTPETNGSGPTAPPAIFTPT